MLHKLVYMANQIGKFFTTEDRDTAVAAIADHLEKFWDPRMRAEIIAYAGTGATDLDDDVKQAVLRLRPIEATSVVSDRGTG